MRASSSTGSTPRFRRFEVLGLSNEAQEHVDWLLAQLAGREDAVRSLVAKGCSVGVWCHWYVEHGKPTIRDETARRLDELGMTLDFELER